jgi:ATP-dependent DNA ligase/predicted DNA-binding WGR domain protein
MSLTCLSQVALDYVAGTSNKIYVIQVQQDDSGSGTEYVASGYYGKRGATLSTAEKYRGTNLASAQAAANRLEKEKRGKGYSDMAVSPGTRIVGMPSSVPVWGGASAPGTPAPAPTAPTITGPVPMRANVLDEADLEKYLTDPNWVCQKKYDGERSPASLRRGAITATNLKGIVRSLAATSEGELKRLLAMPDFGDERETLVDGEEMPGGVYVIYDVLTLRDNDVRKLPFEERFAMLEELLADHLGLLAPTAFSEAEKRAMLAQARIENWEGLMFRKVSGDYVHGRTDVILKFKLWASATCRVLTANAKRSIQVAVRDEKDDEVFIGNVSVPVSMDIPEVDSLVEVRYLYIHDGGSLYQPVLLGVRTDKDEADLRSSLRAAPPEKSISSAIALDPSGSMAAAA